MRTKLLIFTISVLTLVLFPFNLYAKLADTPWPMIQGGVQHNGLSQYDTSHVDGTVKWKFNAESAIYSSPVVAEDGTIYIGTQNSDMYAINPDGTMKWRFDAGEPVESEAYKDGFHGIISTPAIDSDGVIYFTSLANYLFAVNPDGTEKWRFPVNRSDNIWSSPAIDTDGTIYIGSYLYEKGPQASVGYVFAINPDGTEKWKYETTHVHTSTAINKDGFLYVGGAKLINNNEDVLGQINKLDRNGKLLWSYEFETWQESSPSIGDNGTIYIGSKEGKVYALSPEGELKWSYLVDPGSMDGMPEETIDYVDENYLNGVNAIPSIGKDGTIYVGAWNSYFYALSPEGKLKWKYKTPPAYEGISSSAAIGAEGTIYFGTNSGNFYALNSNGTEKWKFKGEKFGGIVSSPAIGADGTVYVGSSADHYLYAFGGSEEGSLKKETSNKLYIYLVYGGISALGIAIGVFVETRRRKKGNKTTPPY